jgi:hypothetical protein
MATPFLYAHGGGLDKYGCHNNRKVGNYHCHQGEFAGRTFSSQAEMLKELSRSRRQSLLPNHKVVNPMIERERLT